MLQSIEAEKYILAKTVASLTFQYLHPRAPTGESPVVMVEHLAMMRKNWSNFAAIFTETANKRMTLQCAEQLHSHMQLECAQNVVEIAAGAGLGSLDVVQYLGDDRSKLPRETKRTFTITDLSPVMVKMAEQNFSGVNSSGVDVQFAEANGQDLVTVATGSMDRYIASLCLQLTPDQNAMLREAKRVLTPDGIAGFTIWGSPDQSGTFEINAAVNKELGLENTVEHSNFIMGRDLPALRKQFTQAGFQHVQVWPFQCVVELWSGEEFAKLHHEMFPLERGQDLLKPQRLALVTRKADEWLAKGTPIGLETYIIVARASLHNTKAMM